MRRDDDERFTTRQTMLPLSTVNDGRDAVRRTVLAGPWSWGQWRCAPVQRDRQPAHAGCLRLRQEAVCPDDSHPESGDAFAACTLGILRLDGGLVAEVTTFGPEMFSPLGLPDRL